MANRHHIALPHKEMCLPERNPTVDHLGRARHDE